MPIGLHVCAVTSDGGIFLTTRQTDGTWTPFDNVKTHAGDPGRIVAVSCSMYAVPIPWGVGAPTPDLEISVVTTEGQISIAVRVNDGASWRSFRKLPGVPSGCFLSPPTNEAFTTISSRAINPSLVVVPDDLDVFGSTNLGNVWYGHYKGTSGALSQGWNEVLSQNGFFVSSMASGCWSPLPGFDAGMVLKDGRMALQVGGSNPAINWDGPFDVTTRAGNNPGLFVAATTVGVAPPNADANGMQICGVVNNGPPSQPGLFHALWQQDGTWIPFGDVSNTNAGRPGNYTAVSSAADEVGTNFCVVLDDGSLWWTRRIDPGGAWEPFQNVLITAAGNPGRIVAADCFAWFPVGP